MAKILLVDDREHERQYLQILFQHSGHDVVVAENGLDAIAAMSVNIPDLVVTDIVMPTMDGFEFIRQMRGRPETRNTPVIFYTAAYDDWATRALARESTGAGILPKPSEPETVLRTINSVLGESSQQQGTLGEDFRSAHLELVTTKLYQKMEALESANAKLAQSEERLRLALGSASIGTWDFYPTTGELHWDERCKAAFGLPPDALVDYDVFLAGLHPDDRERTDLAVKSALDPNGTGEYDVVYRTVGLKDGLQRYVHAQGQAFFEKVENAREATRFIGTVQDITVRRRAEEALRRAHEDLRQFAYAAAHDLQEPLRNISLSLGFLQRAYVGTSVPCGSASGIGSEAEQLIDHCIASAQHMISMVNGLFAFTSIADDTERGNGLVDANQILQQVLKSLGPSISENAAHITCGTLPMVRIASTHLIQLLQNLVGNALKYRKPGQIPCIEISAVRKEAEWIFSVADKGIGFDPAYAERIFGIFKRLHHRDEYPGTGIGLAICSRIISSYGGRIWAEGQSSAGAIFRFTLPAEQRELERPTAEGPTKILVVEDNPMDVRMIRYALQQQKAWATEITVAEDGEAAIHYLKQQDSFVDASKPDLIVLDLNLPKRDGTEVLRMIRETDNLRDLPVFVFSSSPEVVIEERIRAANVSADQYMRKPSEAEDFIALGGVLRRFCHEGNDHFQTSKTPTPASRSRSHRIC
jgi:PAS domain S-box-containing protein